MLWMKLNAIHVAMIYRNVPIRSALPNRSAPQVSLHIVTE